MIKEALKRMLEKNYPDGVYISVKVAQESIKKIYAYMDKNLPDFEKQEDMHVTLIYSTKLMNIDIKTKEYTAEASFNHFSLFGKEDKFLVAELNCTEMIERNKELVKEYKFISDYDEYKVHFTLSYDSTDIDVSKLPALDFPILLEKESVEPLNTNWND